MVFMSNPTEAIAGATEPVGNMSIEELVAQRTIAHSEPEESNEEESQDTEEAAEEELEESSESTEAESDKSDETEEEAEGNETQEIDLLSLTPEEIQTLAKNGKSRLLQRFGELTAKNKALEERLQAQADSKPLPKTIPASENPFSSLKTADEIQAKYDELEKVVEETDRVLEEHEDYGADDLINFGGKDFTKKEIRTANRNSRAALTKFLPAQKAEIQRSEQRKAMTEQFNAAIPEQIPEMADETTDMAKQFAAMRTDPLVEQVRQAVPDLAPQLDYLLAHAARSLSFKKPPTKATTAPVTIPKPKVAGIPVGAAAARSTAATGKDKARQAAARFEETGSEEALIAARIARQSLR